MLKTCGQDGNKNGNEICKISIENVTFDKVFVYSTAENKMPRFLIKRLKRTSLFVNKVDFVFNFRRLFYSFVNLLQQHASLQNFN